MRDEREQRTNRLSDSSGVSRSCSKRVSQGPMQIETQLPLPCSACSLAVTCGGHTSDKFCQRRRVECAARSSHAQLVELGTNLSSRAANEQAELARILHAQSGRRQRQAQRFTRMQALTADI